LTRSDQVIIPGWTVKDSTSSDWGSRNWDELAAAEGLDYIIYPIDSSSRVRLYDRQRSGFNATLQFQPSDSVDVRLDAFSSTLEDYDINQTQQVRIRDVVIGGGRDVTDYVWEFDGNNAVFFDTAGASIGAGWRGLRNIATLRENEWKSDGARAKVDFLLDSGAVWSFQGGVSDGDGALTTYPVGDFREATGFSVDLRDDPRFPQTAVKDGYTDDQLDLWTVSINDRYSDQSNDFFQVDFTSKEIGQLDISTVRFGIKATNEELKRKQIRHAANRAGVSGTLADFALTCGDEPCAVDNFTYANDTLAPFNGSFTLVDFDSVLEAYPRDSREDLVSYNESWAVDERTVALYLQLDLDGEFFGVPYRGNVGARYYETDLTSSGWLDADGESPGRVERTYSDFLPSLNLVFVLKEDLLLRFSGSKVMARPDQEDFSFGGNFNLEEQTARVGNPYLDPFRATAFDLGLEWYFADASLLSAAAFYKDVKSFVSNGVVEGGLVVETPDGPLEFDAFGPVNGEGAKVKGFELGYQHVFAFLPAPFDGFGTQLNYTYTDSTVEIPYTEGAQTYQMPLEGLSESSYNAVLFWESDRVSVRVAYNYRDEFLSNRSNPQGNPVYTDGYGQLDASINWDITDRIGVVVSGVNLNDEARYQYFLTPDRMLAHRASGRRYAVTLRGRF
jgi:TonB-dependent receptor